MAKTNIIFDYEALVADVTEVRESLGFLQDWLTYKPKLDDPDSYLELITGYDSHTSLLNILTKRLINLEEEHRAIIEQKLKELREGK